MPRRLMPLADTRELSQGIELEKGFSETEAKAEAGRCLQCGLVCYQHTDKQEGQLVQIEAAVNT
jgi:hypothetical protein